MDVCVACRGTAVTMKNMLEIAFPGTEVILANYPPPLPKHLLSKVVPVVQIGVIVAGEQTFPMLGFVAPPPWYYNLRSNRFGTIASAWLLGNALQSFLHSSGAFEVYFNDELRFSGYSGHVATGALDKGGIEELLLNCRRTAASLRTPKTSFKVGKGLQVL